MGGKHRHSQDRMFITATEWRNEYGGKKSAAPGSGTTYSPLPFTHCALSLSPYQTPVCTKEGVLFDYVNLAEFIQKYKKNPITGEPMGVRDIIRLNMAKNTEGEWHCPVTFKTFGNNTAVSAIRTTGNVYSAEAIKELNIVPKNYTDLMTGEPFTRADIIVLQDPNDPEVVKRRDINYFEFLKQVRAEAAASRAAEGSVRHTPTTQAVMAEVERLRKQEEEAPTAKSNPALYSSKSSSNLEVTTDVDDILALRPTIEDVNPGRQVTDQRAGGSFTSTVEEVHTKNAIRLASADDIRDAKWQKMRQVGKKAYVQLQTNLGNLNFEIHCDWAPRTSWNFITLCERGYYNNTMFHRLIPGFMVQGGDPTGTGSGGQSAFGKPFRDEFDNRIYHDKRGILSMANSGSNTNSSQFFVTFQPQPHLNLKHPVFGRLVGGNAVLDRIEAIGVGAKDTPAEEIKILNVHVLNSPISEANDLLIAMIKDNMSNRLASQVKSCIREEAGSAAKVPTPKIGTSISTSTVPKSSSSSQDVATKSFVPSQQVTSAATIASSSVGSSISSSSSSSSSSSGGMSEADRIAAFLKSQGMEPDDVARGEAGEPSYKKKKVGGGGFSNW